MFEELKEIAKEYTEEEVNKDTKLRGELGLSSFDLISLIGELEEKYNIKIDDADLADIITVQDLIDYIENKK